MPDLSHWPRRDFLSLGAGAAAGWLLPGAHAQAQAQRHAAAPDLWLELTAAIRTRFMGFAGLQCHMLEHAAAGLMRNYEVR